MPFTTNSPATYEHDNDGDLSPRPLDEIFAAQPMLPPPLPPLKPLELASIWDSDMIHKFHDENGRLFVAFLAIVKSLHLYTWPTVSITIRGGRGIMLDPIQIVLCVTGATDGTFFG